MGDDLDDTAIVWFRRDLRVHDQPIFDVAAARAKRALAVFVLDETLLGPSGKARRTFLYRSLRDLDESLGGRLLVVRGDPVEVIPKLAGAVKAGSVHIAADFGPYGRERDEAVEKALGERDVELVRTGSPYAVAPGRITKSDGEPY
jgi:deoxyribodipyrimidine photo-lyase